MIQSGTPAYEPAEEERLSSPEMLSQDSGELELSLRPKSFRDYIGQDQVKEKLAVYIEAARLRGEALDHVLLYGPPGLGKTTLSGIIAHELGVNLRITSGPAIEKPGDLAALLTNLGRGDVLFVDEIHRLSRTVEEVAQHPGGFAAVYADRRDNACRTADTAAAGAVRHCGAAGTIYTRAALRYYQKKCDAAGYSV